VVVEGQRPIESTGCQGKQGTPRPIQKKKRIAELSATKENGVEKKSIPEEKKRRKGTNLSERDLFVSVRKWAGFHNFGFCAGGGEKGGEDYLWIRGGRVSLPPPGGALRLRTAKTTPLYRMDKKEKKKRRKKGGEGPLPFRF